jgi:hypothetical protein
MLAIELLYTHGRAPPSRKMIHLRLPPASYFCDVVKPNPSIVQKWLETAKRTLQTAALEFEVDESGAQTLCNVRIVITHCCKFQ